MMKMRLGRAAALVAAVTTFFACGGDTPLGPEAPRQNPKFSVIGNGLR